MRVVATRVMIGDRVHRLMNIADQMQHELQRAQSLLLRRRRVGQHLAKLNQLVDDAHRIRTQRCGHRRIRRLTPETGLPDVGAASIEIDEVPLPRHAMHITRRVDVCVRITVTVSP